MYYHELCLQLSSHLPEDLCEICQACTVHTQVEGLINYSHYGNDFEVESPGFTFWPKFWLHKDNLNKIQTVYFTVVYGTIE